MKAAISRAALAAIRAHMAGSPHEEVCGLLFGTEMRIEVAQPAENVAKDPETAFEIDPRALFAAIRAERAGGPQLIGHYHSHPSGKPVPSDKDAAMALDIGRLWLIGAEGEFGLWRATEPGRLKPVELALASDGDAGH